MISFLVSILLFFIVIYVLYLVLDFVMSKIPMDARIKTIVYLIVGILVLIWFLNFTGLMNLDLNRPVLSSR